VTGVSRRFGRFALVGLAGVVVQVTLIALLTKRVHMRPVLATGMAVEITVLHNFFWHQRFTWRDRGQKTGRLWRFHLSNGLVSVAGNTLLMYCLVERLRVPPLISTLVSIAVCSAANFALADGYVYAEPGDFRRNVFRDKRG
jgi:putative flippase GtrA